MSKFSGKSFLAGLFVGVLVTSCIAAAFSHGRPPGPETSTCDIKVYVDDQQIDFTASDGVRTEPLLVGGTAYIPLRLFSEQLGQEVFWDEQTGSIYIGQHDGKEEQEISLENLLFLGDSLIYNPEDVSNTFTQHGHQVFAAIGATLPQFYGLTGQEVTIGMRDYYETDTIAGRDCNGLVILMGANDLANHDENTVYDQYMELLQELRSASGVPVFILKVFPVNRNYSKRYGDYEEKNRRTAALNEMLRQYCESEDHLYFVDATKDFQDDEGLFQHDYGDGLHMDPEYYGMFYDNIMEALTDLKEKN